MDDVVGERVAALCGELSRWPELATMIRDAGALPQLSELLALLANRSEPDERHVTALIDVIEDACARQGLPALTRRVPSLPPGTGADTRGIAGWTCPLGRCSRVVLQDETPHPPTCAAARGEDGRMKSYSPGLR
ncbi:hypothetical protein [Streptomyces sp. NBC_01285]|uniref:hypothetical protein n=1 Tax=Streptomyces sp. NBC_01285 TaxID=2903813 RepID=UPI002255E0E6|nr:hypothetical protein [Streptomyces sp. NBC_01285]MCX4773714.1 hypothetical protein [Streptomyces sp. NBC_01285]